MLNVLQNTLILNTKMSSPFDSPTPTTTTTTRVTHGFHGFSIKGPHMFHPKTLGPGPSPFETKIFVYLR